MLNVLWPAKQNDLIPMVAYVWMDGIIGLGYLQYISVYGFVLNKQKWR